MVYGTNKLLKKGAITVTDARDIVEHFPQLYFDEKIYNENEENTDVLEIPKEYMQVYKFLKINPAEPNIISQKLKIQIKDVNRILFMLELNGNIIKLANGEYKVNG